MVSILFLPSCPDVIKLHAYMKANFAILEEYQVYGNKVIDDATLTALAFTINPISSPNAVIKAADFTKIPLWHSFGNGATNHPKYGCWVVLPDGYTLTAAQIATIEAYAVNPT